MYPFSTPGKYQKILRFSDVFRGSKNGPLGTNGLININNNCTHFIKLAGWQLSGVAVGCMKIFHRGNILCGNCPGGYFPGGNFPGGSCPEGNFPRGRFRGWELSRWDLFWVKIFFGGSFPGGNCPVGISGWQSSWWEFSCYRDCNHILANG